MSVLLKRAQKETVAYEPRTGTDGQGAPSYGSSVNTEARVHERAMGRVGDASGTEFVIGPDGTEVNVSLTLYILGDENNIPSERDRITLDGSKYIVMQRTPYRRPRSARDTLSHVRLRCADE